MASIIIAEYRWFRLSAHKQPTAPTKTERLISSSQIKQMDVEISNALMYVCMYVLPTACTSAERAKICSCPTSIPFLSAPVIHYLSDHTKCIRAYLPCLGMHFGAVALRNGAPNANETKKVSSRTSMTNERHVSFMASAVPSCLLLAAEMILRIIRHGVWSVV